MFIRKASSGEYYVCKSKVNRLGKAEGEGQNWFLLKEQKNNKVILGVGHISFPKEFFGKKVRLKVEVIEDE